MANTIFICSIAVDRQDIILPINDWTKDVGDLLQQAYDNLPDSGLICMGGRRGIPLHVLIEIRNFCQFRGLSFLDRDCATLQGFE